jgi:hypothetical protein
MTQNVNNYQPDRRTKNFWTEEKTTGGESLKRNGLIWVFLEVYDDNDDYYNLYVRLFFRMFSA